MWALHVSDYTYTGLLGLYLQFGNLVVVLAVLGCLTILLVQGAKGFWAFIDDQDFDDTIKVNTTKWSESILVNRGKKADRKELALKIFNERYPEFEAIKARLKASHCYDHWQFAYKTQPEQSLTSLTFFFLLILFVTGMAFPMIQVLWPVAALIGAAIGLRSLRRTQKVFKQYKETLDEHVNDDELHVRSS